MKISFHIFPSFIPFNMHLQSSSKFLEFLKSAGKRFKPPGTRVVLRRNPEGSFGVGFRDTWHNPKESGGVFRCGLPGHVAHSEGIRRGLSVWAFGTRGTLRRYPKGSLGVGFRNTWHTPKVSEGVSRCGLSGHVAHSEGIRRGLSVWAFGTYGTVRRNPEGSLGVGFQDTWHTPKESRGVSRCGLSGHVAHSEGIQRGISVWSFGTCGTLRRNPKGSLGVGYCDTWHTPKESEGVSRCGLLGHVAHS